MAFFSGYWTNLFLLRHAIFMLNRLLFDVEYIWALFFCDFPICPET
jgi:hypothetical protein